jgi:periplasmic divalent cation tolerance protein
MWMHPPQKSIPSACVVLTTTADPKEAELLAHTLVEERLVACATIIPSIRSIYRWKGKVETGTETLLLLKTTSDLVPGLQTRLLALHSYETPEFLVLGVDSGSSAYLDWLQSSLLKP